MSQPTLDVLLNRRTDESLDEICRALRARDSQFVLSGVVPADKDEVGHVHNVVEVQMREEETSDVLDTLPLLGKTQTGRASTVEQQPLITDVDDL